MAQGLSLSYELFDFAARGWQDGDLAARLKEAESAGLAGVNVTYPFKQSILPLLDRLDPAAKAVGAVNTVRFDGGTRVGYNTDVSGFGDSFREGLPGAQMDVVVQFGAGGAGSATALALLHLGVRKLILVDADAQKASALAKHLRTLAKDADILCAEADRPQLDSANGIINATPMGMAEHPGMPLDPALLRADQWVADIVYFPLETELLKAARARGCRTLSGRGMVVNQAAEAFEIFTRIAADRSRMSASFDRFPGMPAA